MVNCLATKLCGTGREMIWCPKHSQLQHFLTHDLLHAINPFHDISRRGVAFICVALGPLASEPVSQIWSQWRQLLEGLVPTSLHGMFHGLHWPQMATGISGLRTGQQGLELPFPENSQVALRPC